MGRGNEKRGMIVFRKIMLGEKMTVAHIKYTIRCYVSPWLTDTTIKGVRKKLEGILQKEKLK